MEISWKFTNPMFAVCFVLFRVPGVPGVPGGAEDCVLAALSTTRHRAGGCGARWKCVTVTSLDEKMCAMFLQTYVYNIYMYIHMYIYHIYIYIHCIYYIFICIIYTYIYIQVLFKYIYIYIYIYMIYAHMFVQLWPVIPESQL